MNAKNKDSMENDVNEYVKNLLESEINADFINKLKLAVEKWPFQKTPMQMWIPILKKFKDFYCEKLQIYFDRVLQIKEFSEEDKKALVVISQFHRQLYNNTTNKSDFISLKFIGMLCYSFDLDVSVECIKIIKFFTFKTAYCYSFKVKTEHDIIKLRPIRKLQFQQTFLELLKNKKREYASFKYFKEQTLVTISFEKYENNINIYEIAAEEAKSMSDLDLPEFVHALRVFFYSVSNPDKLIIMKCLSLVNNILCDYDKFKNESWLIRTELIEYKNILEDKNVTLEVKEAIIELFSTIIELKLKEIEVLDILNVKNRENVVYELFKTSLSVEIPFSFQEITKRFMISVFLSSEESSSLISPVFLNLIFEVISSEDVNLNIKIDIIKALNQILLYGGYLHGIFKKTKWDDVYTKECEKLIKKNHNLK